MNKFEKYEDSLIRTLKVKNTLLEMKIKEIIVEDITKDNLENLQKIITDLQSTTVRLKICLEIKDFNNKNE